MCMETPQETQARASIAAQIEELQSMPIPELNQKYLVAFGVKPPVSYRQYLVRRIAWQLQSLASGGLSETALTRARQITSDLQFDGTAKKIARVIRSKGRKSRPNNPDPRQPAHGSVLTRI